MKTYSHQRTTVRLAPELLRRAKAHAAQHHTTVTALIEEGLQLALGRRNRVSESRALRLPTFRSGGTRPGVDLENSALLYDIMDGIR